MKKTYEQLFLSSASGSRKTRPKNNEIFKTQKFFGGDLLHKKRKSQRPLSKKDSIHFVLRSTWAMGPNSFLAKRNHNAIRHIILKFSKKFGVRIYQQSINSNHLHLLLRITNRTLYTKRCRARSQAA